MATIYDVASRARCRATSRRCCSRIPVVQLMRQKQGLRSDVVTVDEEAGAFEAVAHLLRPGCRRIGMLNGPDVSTSRRRRSGGREALETWQRPLDPDLVVADDLRVEAGHAAERPAR